MEAVAIKERTKELIDTLDDNQAQLVFHSEPYKTFFNRQALFAYERAFLIRTL